MELLMGVRVVINAGERRGEVIGTLKRDARYCTGCSCYVRRAPAICYEVSDVRSEGAAVV